MGKNDDDRDEFGISKKTRDDLSIAERRKDFESGGSTKERLSGTKETPAHPNSWRFFNKPVRKPEQG